MTNIGREEIKERARRMASIMQPEEELERLHKLGLLYTLSNQLMELGFDCMADGKEVISVIETFNVDTSKMSIPDGDYAKFRKDVLAGDYDTKCSDELTLTDEQKKYIDDAVKAGKAHIMY